jgi:hypothetical protein
MLLSLSFRLGFLIAAGGAIGAPPYRISSSDEDTSFLGAVLRLCLLAIIICASSPSDEYSLLPVVFSAKLDGLLMAASI